MPARSPLKPRRPAGLTDAVLPDHDLEDEVILRNLTFANLDLSAREADSAEFVGCVFGATDLSGTSLERSSFGDCTFEYTSLANLQAMRSTLSRVRLTGARMTGVQWIDGVVKDTVFDECRLDLSGWRYTKFTAVEFTGCNLAGADFTGADLSGVQFTGCDLTRAQFSSATMAGARFQRCALVDIGGLTSWRGAVVSPEDLPALSYSMAAALGVQVSS